MKIISEKDNKKTIVLQENDCIEIETLYRNPLKIQIKIKDGTIIIKEKIKKKVARG